MYWWLGIGTKKGRVGWKGGERICDLGVGNHRGIGGVWTKV